MLPHKHTKVAELHEESTSLSFLWTLHLTSQHHGQFSGKLTFSWNICLFMPSLNVWVFLLSLEWAIFSHQNQRKIECFFSVVWDNVCFQCCKSKAAHAILRQENLDLGFTMTNSIFLREEQEKHLWRAHDYPALGIKNKETENTY